MIFEKNFDIAPLYHVASHVAMIKGGFYTDSECYAATWINYPQTQTCFRAFIHFESFTMRYIGKCQ